MLCIDIFITEINVVTSGSFINLIRLLQIVLKMAGIRVYSTNKYAAMGLFTLVLVALALVTINIIMTGQNFSLHQVSGNPG
jgi:hypothetical protein